MVYYNAHVITPLNGPCSGSSAHHSNSVSNRYEKWLKENEITEYEYRYKFNDHSYEYDIHSFYFIYWFVNKTDAMAFKLRWI